MKPGKIIKVVLIVGVIIWLIAIVGLIAKGDYEMAGTVGAAPFVGAWIVVEKITTFVVSLFR